MNWIIGLVRTAPIFLALFTVSVVATPIEFKIPTPKVEVLPNGLQVAWFESSKVPVVDVVLLIRSGSKQDPIGKAGTADLISNTLERGAAGKDAIELSVSIENLAAQSGVDASDDFIILGMHGFSRDSSFLLERISDLSRRPDFPPAEVEREKRRMLDRLSRFGDHPESLVSLLFQLNSLNGSVYGRGGAYTKKEIESIRREDLIEYHQRYFRAKNAILMIVGKADREKFRADILKRFGDWSDEPVAPITPIRFQVDSSMIARKKEILYIPRDFATQSQIRIGLPLPPIHSSETYALRVANSLLGEMFTSRLNQALRDETGLVYGIHSDIAYNLEQGELRIQTATQSENAGIVIKKTLEILGGFKQKPVTEFELNQAKEFLIGSFPLAMSNLSGVASRWLSQVIFELGPDFMNEFVPQVSAVTLSQAQKTIEKNWYGKFPLVVVSGGKGSLKVPGYSIKRVNGDKIKAVSIRPLGSRRSRS